jgi:uncharacterized protein
MVAGGAEGIGAAFSELLARKGINLVLIDIKAENMLDLTAQLKSNYGIKVIEIIQNLSEKDAPEKCIKSIEGLDCRLMVYIPAYSPVKPFQQNTPEELDLYIDLNTRTPLHLTYKFIAGLKSSMTAGIILMSSLAGLKGPKFVAPYAATKAFNILLAEGLYFGLEQHCIDILSCCAGMTDTPTFRSSNPKISRNWPGLMHPNKVAELALNNLGNKPVCISGKKNRLSSFLMTRLLPQSTALKMVAKSMDAMYPQYK